MWIFQHNQNPELHATSLWFPVPFPVCSSIACNFQEQVIVHAMVVHYHIHMLSVESYVPLAHVDFPAQPKSQIACHFLVHVSVNAVVGAE